MRICKRCNIGTDFYTTGHYCKTCCREITRINHRKRVERDPSYKQVKRNTHIKYKFGLTLEQYLEKLKAQGSICALCGVELPTSGPFTHLDHCHTTGKLRDFLCTNCNRGLGHFKDSPEVLRKAADYVESHRINVTDPKEE